MKKNIVVYSLFIALVALFSACKFSTGIKKDLSNGLTSTYNGLSVEEIILKENDGTRLQNNKVSLGSKISVSAQGVENFEQKDGRVYPGCEIIVTDKNKKEVINSKSRR